MDFLNKRLEALSYIFQEIVESDNKKKERIKIEPLVEVVVNPDYPLEHIEIKN